MTMSVISLLVRMSCIRPMGSCATVCVGPCTTAKGAACWRPSAGSSAGNQPADRPLLPQRSAPAQSTAASTAAGQGAASVPRGEGAERAMAAGVQIWSYS